MKMNLSSLLGTGVAVALALTILSPVITAAQPVKGAQLLMPKAAAVSEAAPVPTMACGKCTTEYTSQVDTTVRGANKPTVLVAQHGCGSCETGIKTVGFGKQAKNAASHSCSMGGSENASCCQ